MKVLLIGHALGPGLGSEPGNTWNSAGVSPRRARRDAALAPAAPRPGRRRTGENARPGLRIHWVTLNDASTRGTREKSEKGLKLHYLLWQRGGEARAARRCESQSRVRRGASLQLGHGQRPAALAQAARAPSCGADRRRAGDAAGVSQIFQGDIEGRSAAARRAGAAAVRAVDAAHGPRAAAVVLATNQETRHLLERGGAAASSCFSTTACRRDTRMTRRPSGIRANVMKLLWAGRCEPRRRCPLGSKRSRHVRATAPRCRRRPVRGACERRPDGTGHHGPRRIPRPRAVGDDEPALRRGRRVPLHQPARQLRLRRPRSDGPRPAHRHAQPPGRRDFVPAGAGIKVPVTTPRATLSRRRSTRDGANDAAEARALWVRRRWTSPHGKWDASHAAMISLYEDVAAIVGIGIKPAHTL